MSNATPPPAPGFRNQSGARTVFRLLGVVVVLVALWLMVTAGMDFVAGLGSFEGPSKFWMFFVGLPLLAVGGWLLMAGFMGAGARYTAGEYAPVVKDSAHYLTDGKGLLGVGVTPVRRDRAVLPQLRDPQRRRRALLRLLRHHDGLSRSPS